MGLSIDVLKKRFNLGASQGDKLADCMYEQCFDMSSSGRPLFTNASLEGQKLLASQVLVIQHLRRPGTVTPALKDLGARHVGCGAELGHCDAVADNMLVVLAEWAVAGWIQAISGLQETPLHERVS